MQRLILAQEWKVTCKTLLNYGVIKYQIEHPRQCVLYPSCNTMTHCTSIYGQNYYPGVWTAPVAGTDRRRRELNETFTVFYC